MENENQTNRLTEHDKDICVHALSQLMTTRALLAPLKDKSRLILRSELLLQEVTTLLLLASYRGNRINQ